VLGLADRPRVRDIDHVPNLQSPAIAQPSQRKDRALLDHQPAPAAGGA
jgi:hypothetical protein